MNISSTTHPSRIAFFSSFAVFLILIAEFDAPRVYPSSFKASEKKTKLLKIS
jgi:hypothetical protein